jgi:hypothetical protein
MVVVARHTAVADPMAAAGPMVAEATAVIANKIPGTPLG